jgi:hypothetical protein
MIERLKMEWKKRGDTKRGYRMAVDDCIEMYRSLFLSHAMSKCREYVVVDSKREKEREGRKYGE